MAQAPSGRAFFSESGNVPGELRQDTSEFNVIFVHSRLDDYGLPASVFRVYCHLARRAGSGAAFPAVASIARICRLHPQTVRQALRVLVQHRLITREPRPGTTPLYRLTPAAQWQPPTNINGNPSESDAPPPVSESTPTKQIKGHPSEKDAVEGNPVEGDPKKKKTHTPCTPGIPCNEIEAVEQAKFVGVPADFASQEFNRMVSIGWLDGCKRQVRSWPHYIKQRWSKEQNERTERRATSRGPAKRPPAPPRRFSSGDYNQPV
jgi:DNA-binding transcriptional ArsR family regulator